MPNPLTPPRLPELTEKPEWTGLSLFLGIALGYFLLSAAVSVIDDSVLALFGRQDFTVIRSLMLLLLLPLGFLIYLMVAILPGIPKRVFLTVALFLPVSCVAVLPLLIYFHAHAAWLGLGVSILQLLAALLCIRWLTGSVKPVWPLVPPARIAARKFSFGHFAAVILLGLLVLLPGLLACTAGSAKLAADHFSAGFVNLSRSGVSMEVRDYLRDDGRKITLVPMSHVGETDFYHELAASFPEDSVVLMEGVSDNRKLVQAPSSYSKMAESIGVVEQQKAFKPRGVIVPADVDMSEFSPETLAMLKSAMLIHSKGVTAETLPILMSPAPPGLEKRLMEDILTKRNRHLLEVLHRKLPESHHIIVPWGAAHMPEIAREIEKSGFKVADTRRYMAIRFGS